MKYILKYLLIALLFSSCGVNHYLRKADRALKKAEQLGAKLHADTLWKLMEVPVPEIKRDTILKSVSFRDTITVIQDNITTRIKYDTVTRTMFLESECIPDTITVRIPVIVNKQISSPRGFWYYFRFIAIALIVGFILGAIFWASLRAWIKSFL